MREKHLPRKCCLVEYVKLPSKSWRKVNIKRAIHLVFFYIDNGNNVLMNRSWLLYFFWKDESFSFIARYVDCCKHHHVFHFLPTPFGILAKMFKFEMKIQAICMRAHSCGNFFFRKCQTRFDWVDCSMSKVKRCCYTTTAMFACFTLIERSNQQNEHFFSRSNWG